MMFSKRYKFCNKKAGIETGLLFVKLVTTYYGNRAATFDAPFFVIWYAIGLPFLIL